MEIRIRFAGVSDLPLVLRFIRQKAKFDGYPAAVEASAVALKQALLSDTPLLQVLLAEVEDEAVGFATVFRTYSTFLARSGLWLDDLYVRPHLRGCGVGTALMRQVVSIAHQQHCKRIEWTVATKNVLGIEFYRQQGAEIRENVRLCRLICNDKPAS